MITETSRQLIKAGGKRLRPAFSLLSGKFHDFDIEKILPLAVALELIHMATLIHDDVVDAALTRRGKSTVKAQWGNRISTHVGDYLFGKSLILLSSYQDSIIPNVLSNTSVKMCEGEIYQISASYDSQQTIKDYFYRVNRKTALLIAASCQLGAAACGASPDIYMALRRYGHNVGMAFQITDDILDMTAEQECMGKPIGGDLRQGIITLPVILALKNSTHQKRLYQLINKYNKSENEIQEAINIIKKCKGLEMSSNIAYHYIEKAKQQLDYLPDISTKKTLMTIAEFITYRNF
ncbi:MAG: polyprenyl synthetase family protein [Clostridiales bacterium]|nr:polyprenyl synthetase family protein [Clostridiales bacterium]MCF8021924.1 polyprenyl synthetase family protein [Clostridiales bacterium]